MFCQQQGCGSEWLGSLAQESATGVSLSCWALLPGSAAKEAPSSLMLAAEPQGCQAAAAEGCRAWCRPWSSRIANAGCSRQGWVRQHSWLSLWGVRHPPQHPLPSPHLQPPVPHSGAVHSGFGDTDRPWESTAGSSGGLGCLISPREQSHTPCGTRPLHSTAPWCF